MDGRSVKVFKRSGQFVCQFIETTKSEAASHSSERLVWECVSYLLENQDILLDWIIDGVHPKWTYR